MQNFIPTAITVLAFLWLIILPGVFFILFLEKYKYIAAKNIYQGLCFSFIFGILIWLPLSFISYTLKISSSIPIYFINSLIIVLAIIFNKQIIKKIIYLYCNKHGFPSFYLILVTFISVFVGYISQYQTGDSDAFAHIASIRNIAISSKILSCDWVLGNGAPIASTYGCNPLYLIIGMLVRVSNFDIALLYPAICGILFFIFSITIYTFIFELAYDSFMAKVSSIFVIFASFLNWFLIIGNSNYFSLDPLNNLIFPQHLDSYVLFPLMMIFFIRYLKENNLIDFLLLASCFLVVCRIHPAWLFWSPIIIFGILVSIKLHGKLRFLSWQKFYGLIFGIFILSLISISGYIFCENTFPSDIKIISPLALWQGSGKNLFVMSKYLFIYDPRAYLIERALFDFFALFILYRLAKESASKDPADLMHDKFKLLFGIYSGTLISVSLIIFNPLATYMIVTYMKSSVVLYRIFGLVTPFLSFIAIYAYLSILKSKLSKNAFNVSTITMLVVFCFALVFWKFNYLNGLMLNKGGYYSTYESINKAPFSYFRQLDQGNIAIDTSMATAVAALTALDPITTEVWRAKSIDDIAANKKDNDALLEFSATTDELLEIIKRRKIKYIFMSRENIIGNRNIKSHLELVHLKSSFDGASLWEVNEGIGR
jgi:hypothetical protein